MAEAGTASPTVACTPWEVLEVAPAAAAAAMEFREWFKTVSDPYGITATEAIRPASFPLGGRDDLWEGIERCLRGKRGRTS